MAGRPPGEAQRRQPVDGNIVGTFSDRLEQRIVQIDERDRLLSSSPPQHPASSAAISAGSTLAIGVS
jgi:hypothetical protein